MKKLKKFVTLQDIIDYFKHFKRVKSVDIYESDMGAGTIKVHVVSWIPFHGATLQDIADLKPVWTEIKIYNDSLFRKRKVLKF